METIGQSVRRLRKENKLTQAQLALYSGVSTKFINQLENGKPELKLDKIQAVLSVFDCTLQVVKERGEARWKRKEQASFTMIWNAAALLNKMMMFFSYDQEWLKLVEDSLLGKEQKEKYKAFLKDRCSLLGLWANN